MKRDLKGFGERLTQTIENRYFTAYKLSQKSGISKGLMSTYCNGKRFPSVHTLMNICINLDCSPDWLSKGEGSIDEKFDFSKFDADEGLRRLKAEKIGDFIEIKYMITRKEYREFLSNCIEKGLM